MAACPPPPNRPSGKRNRKNMSKSSIPKVKGSGAYTMDGKQYKGFSPDYGSRLGSSVGEGLQSLAEVFGFGDYHVKQNSIAELFNGSDPPNFRSFQNRDVRIVHREYVADLLSGALVGGSSIFSILQSPVNPGNAQLFPWLSTIAPNFQEWEAHGIILELKTLSSDYANNTVLGSMFGAVKYNVHDPAPVNKRELENIEQSTSQKISTSLFVPVECAKREGVFNRLLVAANGSYGGGDIALYDLGNFFYGSFGVATANVTIAEVWVTYDITLAKAVLDDTVGDLETFKLNATAITAATFNTPFATLIEGPNSTDDIKYAVNPANLNQLIVSMPNVVGRYLCVMACNPGGSTSTTLTNYALAIISGCTAIFEFPGGGNYNTAQNANSGTGALANGGSCWMFAMILDVPVQLAGNGVPQFAWNMTFGTVVGGTAVASLYITRWNVDVT